MLTAAALIDGSLFELASVSWKGLSSVAFLGLLGTAVAFTWYAGAVHQLGATRAGVFINLVPVCAVLLGALLLGERLALATLAGGALVLLGVLITNRAPAGAPLQATVTDGAAPKLAGEKP